MPEFIEVSKIGNDENGERFQFLIGDPDKMTMKPGHLFHELDPMDADETRTALAARGVPGTEIERLIQSAREAFAKLGGPPA